MKRETIVVKYGSSSVSTRTGMDQQRLLKYAADLAALHEQANIIVVSSGSVAAGRYLWAKNYTGKADANIRHFAMLGSAVAFTSWQESLLAHGILAGQLLVTHREVDDPTEGPSLLAAIEANMKACIITIINENDALSDTELAKLSYGGDNDGLAAHIAISLGAKKLCLLTDVDGVLVKGKLLARVEANEAAPADVSAYVLATTNPSGRGGMISKITAASAAAKHGTDAFIANANAGLQLVVTGQSGTHFVAAQIKGRIVKRKPQ